jgi:DNA-binding PadR family transcriptional regulator
MTETDSALGYAILGLLREEPRSGYDVRKVFVTTPLGLFSDSPGAIYPALRRLAKRTWIAATATSRGGRRKQVFAATDAGRRALDEWLATRPGKEDVAREWHVLMLRLAFMPMDSARLRQFLSDLDAGLGLHLAELEEFLARHGRTMPITGRLAFESGVEGVRAQARWCAHALAVVSRHRRLS